MQCLGILWIGGLAQSNSGDFRNFYKVFIDGLNQLCVLAQQSIDNSIAIFSGSPMFIKQIIPRVRFHDEINITMTQFQKKTPIEFARTLNLIRATTQGNALIAVFSTNWQPVMTEKGKGRNASFHNEPVTHVNAEQNTSCSCATSPACTQPAQLFLLTALLPYYTFKGLRLGCYSLESVLGSSLSCFYSFSCIITIRQAMEAPPEEIIRYLNSTDNMTKFNSTLTRFNINDTIETLASEMFIESWSTNASYERFFNSCAPAYCTYKVYYRFDAPELLTTFLSVYVGLSLGIHITVPYLVKVIKKTRHRFRVAPMQ